MWADAQRDGRPAEYRWRHLFSAAVWLTPTTRMPYSNAAKTRLGSAKPVEIRWGAANYRTASGPKCAILWERVEEILLLNKFFPCLNCEDIARQSCAMVPRWRFLARFASCIFNECQIWCSTADPRSTLTCQILSECAHCVGFCWPKTTILGKF